MIHEALNIIISEINPFLHLRLGNTNNSNTWVIPNSLVTQNGTLSTGIEKKIVASVVNLEEDRISRSLDIHRKQLDGTITTTKPEIRFNLYLLFAAHFPGNPNNDDYLSGLKALSGVISFFQQKNVFSKKNSPNLPEHFEKLTIEHYSLTLEQTNHLWGALGAKYLPSVVYKVRLIAFQEDDIQSSGPPINTVDIQSNDLQI